MVKTTESPPKKPSEASSEAAAAKLSSGGGSKKDEVDLKRGKMQLPTTSSSSSSVISGGTAATAATSTTSISTSSLTATASTSNQQHSPGSTSSCGSSNGSNYTGYTRQTNPRPRHGKHLPTSSSTSSVISTASTITSSLPPSAVSAAPYIPYQAVGGPHEYMHHPHHHVTYAYGPPPPPPDGGGHPQIHHGMAHPPPPPPPPSAVSGAWISPYYPHYEAGNGPHHPPPMPTFVQHVNPVPPPHKGGRFTPSPHPTSSSSSSATSSTTTVVAGDGSAGPGGAHHVVNYHLQQGEVINLQLGDGRVEVIPGPATIRLVTTNSPPPVPLPMQVPTGHMVQQIVDQSGTLQHVILSPDPMISQQQPPPPPQPHCAVPLTPYVTAATTAAGVAAGTSPAVGATPFTTPTTVSSGAPPRQPFPNTQYGPPPGAPLLPSGGPATPTPSSHGPSPTPSSGSGGGSFGSQPPGYPRSSKFQRMRGSTKQTMATPPASPAKNRGKESFRSPSSGSGSSGIGSSSGSSSSGVPTNSSGGSGSSAGSGSNGNKSKSDSRTQDDSEESGVGHEDDEEMQQLLVELLSNIRTPKVSEIQARIALLKWGPPVRDQGDGGAKFEPLEHITDAEFRYEVLLSDNYKDGKYRSIFTGHSIDCHCRLTDLRPNTEYHIRIHALTDATLKGGASDTVSFKTATCEPDRPAPPKMIARSKTSLNLRWNAPHDNGAHIQQYILEYDEGKSGLHNTQPIFLAWCEDCKAETLSCPHKSPPETGGNNSGFVEVFKGRTKNYNVTKLKSATTYRFRILAVNEIGCSRPSETVAFSTQGTAPPTPQPPGLREATKSSLHLVWSKRLCDSEFVLHMDDQISGHSFLTVYNGSDTSHISTGLRPNAAYKFRLQAHNEEGKSPWSDEVTYLTLPDVPGPPLRPASKGRLHPHSFKVRWDPPQNDGGSPIKSYILEIDGGHGWQTVYNGSDLECVCENLSPGTQYKVRVACTSDGGVSDYSEICHICTEPVCPGQCAPPRPHGKPKATSLHLKWGWPETDGGSPVTEFEIDMTMPDNKTRAVYRGRETECVVASLLPGRPYLFQVRAHNRVGAGPWSDSLEVVSGAGAPDQPKPPRVTCRSPTTVQIDWEAPIANGALVSEYQLQMAVVASRKCLSPPLVNPVSSSANLSSSTSSINEEDEEEEDDDDDEDNRFDEGDDEEEEERQESLDSDEDEDTSDRRERRRHYRVVKRKRKSFRGEEDSDSEEEEEAELVQQEEKDHDRSRTTRRGKGAKAEPLPDLGDDGPPVEEEQQPEEEQQDDNGPAKEPQFSPLYSGSGRIYEARSLEPATTYLFRVCAVNSAGASEWSDSVESITPPAAPAAIGGVHLKSASATSLTLVWSRPQPNGEHITHYNVDTGSAVLPTPGPDTNFTVTSLRPDTAYAIRVQAVNSVGPGPFSSTARLQTRPLPPAPPRCECVNSNHNSLKLKWGDAKSSGLSSSGVSSSSSASDLCQYTLEMENSRNQFQVIYTGTSVSHKISKLSENKTYRFRLCASNAAGQGPYSQLYEFKTAYAHPPAVKAAPRVSGIAEDGCLVEWPPIKLLPSQGELHYRVSLTKVRDNEAKIIYTGSDVQFRVNGLEAKSEYAIRVCGVRVPTPGSVEMAGTYSPPAVFTTLSGDGFNCGAGGQATASSRAITTSRPGFLPHKGDKSWTDQQWAMVILVGFTLFALFVAVVMQQIIAWGIIPS